MIIQTTKSREQVIEDALTYISLSEGVDNPQIDKSEVGKTHAQFCRLPIHYFRGADLGILYEDIDALSSHERLFFRTIAEEDQKEIARVDLGYWDTCIAVYEESPPEIEKATYLFTLRRIRKVPLKEVRGLFAPRTGDVIETADAQVYNNGCYMVNRAYFERRGGVYHLVAAPYAIIPAEPVCDRENRLYHFAKSLALTNHYEWRVHFGFVRPNQTNVASISICTDPIGVRQAFKMREIPDGSNRRQALKHWVNAHLRSRQDRPAVEVHEHMRGAEEFVFKGLYCKIEPSQHDIRRALKAKEAA